jgi:hypothetical protein
MTLKQATEMVQQFQDWRLGKIDEILYTPSAITEALDILIENSRPKKAYNFYKEVNKMLKK